MCLAEKHILELLLWVLDAVYMQEKALAAQIIKVYGTLLMFYWLWLKKFRGNIRVRYV